MRNTFFVRKDMSPELLFSLCSILPDGQDTVLLSPGEGWTQCGQPGVDTTFPVVLATRPPVPVARQLEETVAPDLTTLAGTRSAAPSESLSPPHGACAVPRPGSGAQGFASPRPARLRSRRPTARLAGGRWSRTAGPAFPGD